MRPRRDAHGREDVWPRDSRRLHGRFDPDGTEAAWSPHMVSKRQVLRGSIVSTSLAAAVVTLSSSGASSLPTGQGCDAWDVTYAVSGNLRLSDTPMGAGDGIYPVGPGEVVLRRSPGTNRVTMVSFELPQRFGIHVKKVFWAATVNTNATARAAPPGGTACSHVAEGTMQGDTVTWATSVSGFRTDGVIDCNGSACGQFGAPPKGTSGLHIPPREVQFKPFEFGPDGKTFTMPATFVSKTDEPRQTAHLALSGREVRRVCAPVASCR